MGTVRFQNVGKQYAGQIVLADFSLELTTGQIVALIGPNGIGKTTLFRMITGDVQPDTGTVTRSRGLEIGYLPQEPVFDANATLRDAVASAFADLIAMEHKLAQLSHEIAEQHDGPHAAALLADYDRLRARFEAAGGFTFEHRLNEILGGLGFAPRDYELPVRALSGGQKCRAALAQLLLQDATLLLLDEPTNHLDIDAVRWLEKFLAGHHGGAVIVSHDRYFLDRLTERTIELTPTPTGAQARVFAGNYSAYVEQREVQRLTEARQYEQDKAFIEKEQAYIRRYMAGQRSRQAKGRLKRLERMLESGAFVTQTQSERKTTKIEFADAAPRSRTQQIVLEVRGLAKRYGDKRLFEGLDLDVWTGHRLGITGPNGAGKSTLLKIVLGLVKPDAGRAALSPAFSVGYYAQDAVDLHPEKTVIGEILDVRRDLLERDARHIAAQFLFTGDDVFKRVANLSGGEQSRVRLMRLILSQPDVLILDEPTNHLDIASREALEAALDTFEGTIIVVSHDRYFLDQVVDRLLVMRPEGCRLHPGNYTTYIEALEAERAAQAAADDAARAAERAAAARRAAKQPTRVSRSNKYRSPLHALPLDQLEARIAEWERQIAALEARFGDAELYRDPTALRRLHVELEAARRELAAAEEVWLERADDSA